MKAKKKKSSEIEVQDLQEVQDIQSDEQKFYNLYKAQAEQELEDCEMSRVVTPDVYSSISKHPDDI